MKEGHLCPQNVSIGQNFNHIVQMIMQFHSLSVQRTQAGNLYKVSKAKNEGDFQHNQLSPGI